MNCARDGAVVFKLFKNPEGRWCYRVIGLIDAQDEDEVRDEERGCAVDDDAGLVAARLPQAGEEDDGEEEEAQRHTH